MGKAKILSSFIDNPGSKRIAQQTGLLDKLTLELESIPRADKDAIKSKKKEIRQAKSSLSKTQKALGISPMHYESNKQDQLFDWKGNPNAMERPGRHNMPKQDASGILASAKETPEYQAAKSKANKVANKRRKKNKDGSLIGAPGSVKSNKGANMKAEGILDFVARGIEANPQSPYWYDDHARDTYNMLNGDREAVSRYGSLSSLISPQLNYLQNAGDQVRAYNHINAGLGERSSAGRYHNENEPKIQQVLDGEKWNTSFKTGPFANSVAGGEIGLGVNIDRAKQKMTNEQYHRATSGEFMTNDVQHAGVQGYDTTQKNFSISDPMHRFMDSNNDWALNVINETPELASITDAGGFKPMQVQSAAWFGGKDVKKQEGLYTPSQLYNNMLSGGNREFNPGVRSGAKDQYDNFTDEIRQAYNNDMFDALTNDFGGDGIYSSMGLLTPPVERGISMYQGQVNDATFAPFLTGGAPRQGVDAKSIGKTLGGTQSEQALADAGENMYMQLMNQDAGSSVYKKNPLGMNLNTKNAAPHINQVEYINERPLNTEEFGVLDGVMQNKMDTIIGNSNNNQGLPAKADYMESNGSSADEIFVSTGMRRTKEGTWAVDIPNDALVPQVRPQGLAMVNTPEYSGLSNKAFQQMAMDGIYESGNIQRSNGKALGGSTSEPSLQGPAQSADEGLYSTVNSGGAGGGLEGQFRQGVVTNNYLPAGDGSPLDQVNYINRSIADLGAMPAAKAARAFGEIYPKIRAVEEKYGLEKDPELVKSLDKFYGQLTDTMGSLLSDRGEKMTPEIASKVQALMQKGVALSAILTAMGIQLDEQQVEQYQ